MMVISFAPAFRLFWGAFPHTGASDPGQTTTFQIPTVSVISVATPRNHALDMIFPMLWCGSLVRFFPHWLCFLFIQLYYKLYRLRQGFYSLYIVAYKLNSSREGSGCLTFNCSNWRGAGLQVRLGDGSCIAIIYTGWGCIIVVEFIMESRNSFSFNNGTPISKQFLVTN